jgi:ribbon-helix-helix protein
VSTPGLDSQECVKTANLSCVALNFPLDSCMRHYANVASMKRTTLYLTEEQLRVLLQVSAKTGAPLAELVRRAIDEVYAKKQK